MNAVSRFPEVVPFNSYSAYQREREHSRRTEVLLAKALILLRMECKRRELRGENVEHIRTFIEGASS